MNTQSLRKRWLRLAILLVLLAALGATAIPALASGEAVRGEFNGWGSSGMAANLGGTFLYSGQITAASDSSSGFKFFKDSNQWYGHGSSITFAQIFSGLSTSGGDSNFNHTQNRYYAFKWNGNDKGVIFQLSGAPAAITAANRTPAAPTSSEAVTIALTLNTAMPAEQAAWLRYTTNGWSSSTVVKMTGSGTAYSATIPAQADGTTVEYYLFTSGDVASIAPADADLMTITYDTNGGSNYRYNVGNPIADAQALWLDTDTLAWNGTAGNSYKLLYDPDGAVNTTAAAATACTFPAPAVPCYVSLSASGTVSGYWKNPNATGLTRLLTALSDANAKSLLKGQVVVAAYNSGGAQIDVSRVQVQSVLDALYATGAKTQTLGASYSGGMPVLRVWAPTAKSVSIRKYEDSTTGTYTSHPLTEDSASGVWSLNGAADWDRDFYLLDVEVYVPSLDGVVHNLVTDPYALTLSTDTSDSADPRSQFVNLEDADLKPAGWDTLAKPALANFEDITLYEMHIRDFSINDASVAAAERGTYLAFTYDGAGPDPNATLSNGMAHLLALQDAGLTHVHLLPGFDIASVSENSVARSVSPNPTGYARDGQEQQDAVAAARASDGFNWGYDPYHYGAPEGSYSTNPDGVTRILEFRRMVSALNRNGLRVVMDVVYNHTAANGQNDKSVLDKVVPGYYYRYTTDGALYTSSCCSDTAAEYEMFEKLMIDTLRRWATEYKVDGFRFDLMNFHTRQNMLNVQAALNAVDPDIYLYGEGWDFGSAKEKGLTTCPNCYAQKYNMAGSGIGSFNDIIRDAAHGGYSTDDTEIRKQGFINGLSYDWNGYAYSNRYQSDLWAAMDRLRSALRGSGTDWNGQGSPFTDDPQESVAYVEKHDNETLFDQNVFKLPVGTGISDRVRAQNMGQSIIGLAQGVPFFQMGSDILRSKSLDRNSYDSGDWFNRVDWSYTTNYFGSGLPPAWDNSSRWDIMAPLLTNTALDPATADIQFAAAHFREILRMRYSSPLFRLPSEAEINARISHYNTANTQDAFIVMRLSDEVGTDLDPNYENILVFFNANKIQQSITIGGANGFTLHPVHTDGVDDDPVITAGATFNDSSDTFTIPARTTAVFVSDQSLLAPTTLDWVGKLWPRGGAANSLDQGAAGGDFNVYVRVYEAGVTDPAGQGAGISCSLHWGRYGQAWNDVPMAFNGQQGSDDEYRGTLSQATLNALPAGTYGFTAYCQKTAEGPQWKSDSYDIDGVASDDDQGDGLITVIPSADSAPEAPGGVLVHLFEWKWTDIQQECAYLGQKGYTAVQISPPNEHLVPTADQGGQAASDYPWWARYQPVTHDITHFTSRSGTWEEFQAMLGACHTAGVDVIVDAVINHTADIEVGTPPTGTAGSQYDSAAATRFYGTQYGIADFHTDCDISSYADRLQVQTCRLTGLPDLNTGSAATQDKLRAYLQSLINAGVDGFRIDGAKHIAAQDMAAIFNGLSGDYYVFQEVIDQSSAERVRDWEYTPYGDVTEFAYPFFLGDKFDDSCGGTLSQLQNLESSMLAGRFALVFTDNHDNQRGHGVGAGCIVDHRDGQEHVLANIFVLAYPYGYPSIMSSYYWQSSPSDNTNDSYGPPTVNGGPGSSGATLSVHTDGDGIPDNCASTYTWGQWACEHRRTPVANMVNFRWVTNGESLTNWQNISADHIAFGRGAQGFVAINQTGSAATPTYQTGMGPGVFCDITQYDFLPASGQCVLPGTTSDAPAGDLITVDASGQIGGHTLNANSAFAIHAGARLNTDYGSLGRSYGLPWHTDNGSGLRLGAAWRSDDGVTRSGDWTAGSGNVQVTANGAAGYLTAWVDWNQDGDFGDTGERILFNEAFTAGQTRTLPFSVPITLNGQTIQARFRLYAGPQTLEALPSPEDGSVGGEVEDFTWAWTPTAVTVSTLDGASQGGSPLLAGLLALGALLILGTGLFLFRRHTHANPPGSGQA